MKKFIIFFAIIFFGQAVIYGILVPKISFLEGFFGACSFWALTLFIEPIVSCFLWVVPPSLKIIDKDFNVRVEKNIEYNVKGYTPSIFLPKEQQLIFIPSEKDNNATCKLVILSGNVSKKLSKIYENKIDSKSPIALERYGLGWPTTTLKLKCNSNGIFKIYSKSHSAFDGCSFEDTSKCRNTVIP